MRLVTEGRRGRPQDRHQRVILVRKARRRGRYRKSRQTRDGPDETNTGVRGWEDSRGKWNSARRGGYSGQKVGARGPQRSEYIY